MQWLTRRHNSQLSALFANSASPRNTTNRELAHFKNVEKIIVGDEAGEEYFWDPVVLSYLCKQLGFNSQKATSDRLPQVRESANKAQVNKRQQLRIEGKLDCCLYWASNYVDF